MNIIGSEANHVLKDMDAGENLADSLDELH
jgi:hypothetical protein